MYRHFANPARMMRLLRLIRLPLALVTLTCMSLGLYYGLVASPPDYQQGELVRIMYVHVPAAWVSLMGYSVMAISSFIFLVWRHGVADLIARQSAVIVMGMALMTLITGALWGKPTWGAYWVWDARLTSVLILFLIVSGYAMLARQSDGDAAKQRACAYLCLLGAFNLPIIKFSVEWWNTLHQPASLLRSGSLAIDGSMLLPLLLMAAGFSLCFCLILSLRIESGLLAAKSARLRQQLLRRHTAATVS